MSLSALSEQPTLLVLGIDMAAAELVGMLSPVSSSSGPIHQLYMHVDSSHEDIAVALAVFAIHDQYPLISANQFPFRAPVVLQFAGRVLRYDRGRTFAPWVLKEVDRLATMLLSTHQGYLEGIRLTLRHTPPPDFQQLPAGFVFFDEFNVARIAPPPPTLRADLTSSPAGVHKMSWLEVVDSDYVRDRYLSSLDRQALLQRAADVMANLPSADVDTEMHVFWVARLAEVIAELRLRYGPYPAGWDDFRNCTEWPGSRRSVNCVNLRVDEPGHEGPYVVKYGKVEYLQPMFRQGRIRVFPASRYSDPSLNVAIRDDELTATINAGPSGVAGFGGLSGPQAAVWPGRTNIAKKLKTNYYVYCLSDEFRARLFQDFDADTALVIYDVAAFRRRIADAMKSVVPEYSLVHASVEYYDPLRVSEMEVDVLMWKHFRYAYQKEVRFAWTPPEPRRDLEAVDVILGPIADIAEIITVRQS